MRAQKVLAAVAALFILVGAGCTPATTPDNQNTNTPTTNQEGQTPSVNDDGTVSGDWQAPSADARALTTSIQMDDTWKTYTNSAFKFGFKWPSRGVNAPTWNVKFLPDNDPTIKDECMTVADNSRDSLIPAERVSVNGIPFCHTAYGIGSGSTLEETDYYTTKNDKYYIVIAFAKSATVCAEGDTKCVTFDWSAYRAQLDETVSTFSYAK